MKSHYKIAGLVTLLGSNVMFTACASVLPVKPNLVVSPALQGNYVLDPAHASVNWSLSHSGLSNYTARFETISGTLDFNAQAPQTSSVDIRLDPASVSTGLPKFDETLAYESKYFDANTYPEIRFVSTSAATVTDNTGTLTGDLTFRGVTKAITLDVTYNGAGKSFGKPGDTLGFSATGVLTRSDFGLTTLTNFGIGDAVTLRIEAEFNEAQ